jgi:AAA ATPase domain
LTLPVNVIGRSDEALAVVEFLDSVSSEPTALVVEGEPGVGKTTVWLSALDQAPDRGCHVLSARPSEAESALAYTGLADMLTGIDTTMLAGLFEPQRIALDRILFRSIDQIIPTDPRAVAAAFHTVVLLRPRQPLHGSGLLRRPARHLGHDCLRQIPHSAFDEQAAHSGDRNQSEPLMDADVGNHRRRPEPSWQIGQVDDDVLDLGSRVDGANHL